MKRYLLTGIFVLIALLLLLLGWIRFSSVGSPKTYQISVITRNLTDDTWLAIREGSEQAASDYHILLNFVNLSSPNNVDEQKMLLQREIKNGAQALAISVADQQALAPLLENLNIPVVCFESSVHEKNISSIVEADNHEIGVSLARLVEELPNSGDILYLDRGQQLCLYEERFTGFDETMKQLGIDYTLFSAESGEAALFSSLKQYLTDHMEDLPVAIVAPDRDSLATTAEIINLLGMHHRVSLFGSGSTGAILRKLETNAIDAVVAQDYFSLGYLAVEQAARQLQGEPVESARFIGNKVITTETLYSTDNERLLFPFVR